MDLQQLREKAAADFRSRGFPTTKEESWRFTDVSTLAKTEFSSGWKPAGIGFDPLGEIVAVFENGRFSREKSRLGDLPKGVRIGSIMDRADGRLGTLAATESAFVAANTAFFADGAFIEIADGVELRAPIHLVHLADASGAAFHLRNLVACGKGAKATVVEEYAGAPDAACWTNAVTESFVDDGASLDHYKIQRESRSAFHFQTLATRLGGEAVFSSHAVASGGKLGRNDIRAELAGKGGLVVCNGLYLLDGEQHFDTHMFIDHAVPECRSHELYKGILDDKARAVFCGRILVRKDAQKTDAIQSNRNLLLSRNARVNSLPQLEIYADDVKCTHGATVGQLDDAALYYLQTRGIDRAQAHAMLTYAFANEVLDEMNSPVAKERIAGLVQSWLEKIVS